MKVLQVVTRDEPGGVQVLTEMIAEGLTRRGHEIETIAMAGNLRRLASTILSRRHDALLSYQVAAGIFASALAFPAGIRLRATHLTAIPAAMRPHWRLLDRLWGQYGIHSTIIANSAATQLSIAAYPDSYRRRTFLIPHGVTPLPMPHNTNWRHHLGVPANTPLLVASGRLATQKNHAIAVAALPLLPGAHLAIAGDGELRDALVAQAIQLNVSDRLHLLGNLDRPSLAALLMSANIYLFPSTWESFGLAGVEAAMLGLPILAADLPVLREVLAPAATLGLAVFHASNGATQLAATAKAMLAQPASPQQRTASATAMQSRHGIEPMVEAYCRLLETLPPRAKR
ncbi:Glycosyl transferase group 1 [Devosia sp. LC5]|uniref:glycosyltransferase family 4 protein n=1 Tax=Devosia sp. LC5 TaxID=1502724 RepID=UPI0004E2E461|nr:glycosyltransferase family 4 protein [Devosia sp. LC5]KFC70684.1 Glycosyl transferase group 1 [Devosia sp. LC5]